MTCKNKSFDTIKLRHQMLIAIGKPDLAGKKIECFLHKLRIFKLKV